PRPQLRDRVPDAAGTLHLHLLDPGARDRGAGRGRESVRPSDRGGRAEETAAPLRSAATLACADRAPRHQLEGAWVPIAASVAGSRLAVGELRVRYLLLEAGGYSIIDRSNHVVDGGRYLVNEELSPATMDIVGGSGPHAGRTMRRIHQLRGAASSRAAGGCAPLAMAGYRRASVPAPATDTRRRWSGTASSARPRRRAPWGAACGRGHTRRETRRAPRSHRPAAHPGARAGTSAAFP